MPRSRSLWRRAWQMTSDPAGAGPESAQRSREARGHRGLALGWLRTGRVSRAIDSLRRALELDPAFLEASLDLGRVLAQQERWHDLEDHCRQAMKYLLPIPEFHKWLIQAVEETRGSDAAFRLYALRPESTRCPEFHGDEILCCVAVRNERRRLPHFVEYYRRLGVDRFLFVDNGSTDGTAEFLLQQHDVHLWSSTLSFQRANFGSAWFELLLSRYGVGHWCVTVDADEYLVFEGSPQRTLRDLCADLKRRGKEAATGLLLDLYSDRPIADTRLSDGGDPLAVCRFFDREFAHRRIELGGPYLNQTLFFGGVRQRVFPDRNDFLLSKVPVLSYQPEVVLASGQHVTNIPETRIAAEQCCLLHFKFIDTFPRYAREEARREVHAMGAQQYKAYCGVLDEDPGLCLYDPSHSIRFEGTEQLRTLGAMRAEPEDSTPMPVPIPGLPASGGVASPFWSVKLTVYDRTDRLERALASVLSQTRGDIEVEVVCDGPADARQQAVRECVERWGGGRVSFHGVTERLGHPEIFNLCILRARGRWVHILHDDDWLEPGYYDRLRAAIEAHPEAGSAFPQHRVVPEGPDAEDPWLSWSERESVGVIGDWIPRIFTHCRVQFSAVAVRRAVFEALGGFDARAGSAFDWDMWKRIAWHHPVIFVPALLVNVGRDATAETSRLTLSGQWLADAFASIDLDERKLGGRPEGRHLARRARARLTRYALDVVVRKRIEDGDVGAALANLRVLAREAPAQATTMQLLRSLVSGAPNEVRA